MPIQIRKAERSQSKLRIGLAGPSGSGKTMSALKLARGIAGPQGRICMIDTERGSGDLYADLTQYDIITLTPPYQPAKYVEAIEAAEDAGYDVIIIDSLSHAWTDEGGLLDQADKLSAGGNRFTVWASLTPQHRKLVNGMLNCDSHIIATVRSKQDYAIERDEKSGKSSVKKLGMAPVQREGMEYEFTVFMDIEQNHVAHSSKDRTNLFKDWVDTINEGTGRLLIEWLNSATKKDTKQTNKQKRSAGKKGTIMGLVNSISEEKLSTGVEYMAVVKSLTELALEEANYDEIIGRLRVRFDDLVDAGVIDRTGKRLKKAEPKVEATPVAETAKA
jgi:hypothetical protein